MAVYKDLRLIICRSEMENGALPRRVGRGLTGQRGKSPVVPEVLGGLKRFVYAGESAFRRKRHQNFAVKFRGRIRVLRDCIVPITIQGEKRVPFKLGAGIFGQHVIMVKGFAPDGGKRGKPVIFVRPDDTLDSIF